MTQLLAVGLGGFVGATLRWWLTSLVETRFAGSFPLGTLAVNLLGCLLIGVLWGVVEDLEALSENARLFLSVGLLGGLTTFSTFGLETVVLWREGEAAAVLAYVGANVVLGVGAVFLGRACLRLFA